MPLISVILPVYCVEEYILSSLQSLNNQKNKNFEVIIVDDGTPDKSIEIADEFLKTTDLQYLIVHQDNGGVSAARNNGIHYAKGKWIMCMDPDDMLHPDTFNMIEHIIETEKKINVIGINFKFVHNEIVEDTFLKYGNYQKLSKKKVTRDFLLRKIRIISPGLLIRKEYIEKYNLAYEVGVRFSEDQLYIWKILSYLDQFVFINEPLYLYLVRSNSTMTASKEEKILSGYTAFITLANQILDKEIDCGELGLYILPRWVLGVLHSSAKHMCFSDFKHLAISMSYQKYMKELVSIPERKTALLARIGMYNCFILYLVMKKF